MKALKYIQSLPIVSEDKLKDVHITIGEHVEHPNTAWGVAYLDGEMVYIFKDGNTYHYLKIISQKYGCAEGLIAYIINDKIWVYAERAYNLVTKEVTHFAEFGIDISSSFLNQITFKKLNMI